MRFSVLAIFLVISESEAFVPGSGTNQVVTQNTLKVTPPTLSSIAHIHGVKKVQLSLFDKYNWKKDGGDRGTFEVSKSNTPTIRKWKQNPNGSITGIISGSTEYDNGDTVTTAAIREKNLSAGKVVTTIQGSKYKLQGKGIPLEAPFRETFSIRNRSAPKEDIVAPKKGSMFFASPKNVPIMRDWKQNANGSVSGKISGSDKYGENEFITTSPMKNDSVIANKVAVTKSGSKYFLEGPGTTLDKSTKASKTMSMTGGGGGGGSDGDDNNNVTVSVIYGGGSCLFANY